jgi:peptidoglycan hydrolase-like protein with peptidoglycan-binding domain
MALRMTLRKGSKGPLVTELQQLLNKVLVTTNIIPDGDFGGNTHKAVIDF